MHADLLHHPFTRWSQSHALIVLEDLHIGNMTRSAKGILEKPCWNVAAKSEPNRSVLDQSWGTFTQMLMCELAERARALCWFPAQRSRQTCSVWGLVEATNRPSRDASACVWTRRTRVNMAKVTLQRGLVA